MGHERGQAFRDLDGVAGDRVALDHAIRDEGRMVGRDEACL